jgi:hypothetical protein
MNRILKSDLLYLTAFFAGLLFYYLHYFNHIEIPSADFMGNFRPFVESFRSGGFQAVPGKLLPAYPLLLSALSSILPVNGQDQVYMTALLLNFSLLLPFLLIAYLIYRKLLGEHWAFFALILLGMNTYTLYSGLNAELEIFLSFVSALTLWLMMKKSSLSVPAAALCSIIKWDAVFMIPGLGLNLLGKGKKILNSAVITLISALPLISWLAFIRFRDSAARNTYVNEIAQRGPNIYKFAAECILVVSGFLQWMGLDVYHGGDPKSSVILILFAMIFGMLLIMTLVKGFRLFLSLDTGVRLPLLTYFSGFMLIHMIYQNSKDRYAIPIIWLLILFIFLAIRHYSSRGFERIRILLTDESSRLRKTAIWILPAIFSIQALFQLFKTRDIHLMAFSLFLHALVFIYLRFRTSISLGKILLVTIIAGLILNFNMSYGRKMLDHHSLSRIEFKLLAQWLNENPGRDRILLISESNVVKYFTGMSSSALVSTGSLKSGNLAELTDELKNRKISLIFIDDFYISRLKVRDPNSLSRKAPLMKELRDHAPTMPSMKLIKTFITGDNSRSYLYGFSLEGIK